MKYTFSGKRSVPSYRTLLPFLLLSLTLPLALCALCMWFLFSSEVHLRIPSKMKTKNKIRKERSEKRNETTKQSGRRREWEKGIAQTTAATKSNWIRFKNPTPPVSFRRVSDPIHRCLQPVSTSAYSSYFRPPPPFPNPPLHHVHCLGFFPLAFCYLSWLWFCTCQHLLLLLLLHLLLSFIRPASLCLCPALSVFSPLPHTDRNSFGFVVTVSA